MILLIIENQKIHIKITRRNINHYRQCGYDDNITLIRIPYWDFNNIENILKEKVFT